MIYYQVQNVINEAQLKEVKWKIKPKAGTVVFCAIMLLVLFIVVLSAILKNYTGVIISLICIIILVVEHVYLAERNVRLTLKRLKESVQAEQIIQTASFTDTAIEVENHTTNAQGKLYYVDIVRFEETAHYYLLITKAKQYISISKEDIENTGQTAQFMDFLAKKCVHVHW